MVWPILISVDVMPRISAALDAGEAGNASAASPASIGTTRIDLPPCLFLASAAGIGPRRAVRQDVRDSRAKQSLPRGSSAPAVRRFGADMSASQSAGPGADSCCLQEISDRK